MLKILRDESTGEMELSGTRSELISLGRQLRSGQGEILLSKVADPAPYSQSLSRVKVRRLNQKIMFSVSEDGEILEVSGGPGSLALLAENVEGFSLEADQSDHLHVDYFPDHDYLAEGADSLVIAIDGESRLPS